MRDSCIIVMKSFIKLFIKGLLVLMPLWAFIIYAKYYMLDYVNLDTMRIIWNNEFTRTKQDKYYSVVIIGDSTANGAYIPEVLSDSTINLSLSGTGIIENYYTLENYLEHNEAPSDVFVSMCDYHLAQDYFTWSECNRTHKLSISQNAEIYENIKTYSVDQLVDITGEEDYWSNVFLYNTYMPSKYAYPIMQSFCDDRRQTNPVEYSNLGIRAGRYYCITNDVYMPEDVSSDDDFVVSPLQDRYIKMLLELCANKGINLHFVKLPVPANFVYFDSYKTSITQYYEDILKDYSNAEFIWPCERYETYYFADGSHFNNHGSLLFSTSLKALYPEVFSDDSLSDTRMEALRLDIIGENNPDFLPLWTGDLGFEIVDYEKNGQPYIDIKNNNGDIISTKSMFINDDGVYEINEIK